MRKEEEAPTWGLDDTRPRGLVWRDVWCNQRQVHHWKESLWRWHKGSGACNVHGSPHLRGWSWSLFQFCHSLTQSLQTLSTNIENELILINIINTPYPFFQGAGGLQNLGWKNETWTQIEKMFENISANSANPIINWSWNLQHYQFNTTQIRNTTQLLSLPPFSLS